MKEAFKYSYILAVICLAASGFLVGINRMTAKRIEAQLAEEKNAAFKDVLEGAERFEPVEESGKVLYYRALGADGRAKGLVFIASAKGYSSVIETVVGMLNDGTIAGIKIINQNETPGLGNRITEVKDETTLWDFLTGKTRKKTKVLTPWFQAEFSGKKSDKISEIQAITGATISSSAVIKSVQEKAVEMQNIIAGKKP